MPSLLTSKKGASLPLVIGIVGFLIASTFILITLVLYQTRALEADFNYQQEYANTQQRIDATINSIIKKDNTSLSFRNDLSEFMDVSITEFGSNTLLVSSTLAQGQVVKGYLSKLGSDISMVNEYYAFDGLEDDFEVNPLFTPSLLLSAYMQDFFNDNFPSIQLDDQYDDIDDFVQFIENLTKSSGSFIEVDDKDIEKMNSPIVSGHWYVDGSVSLSKNTDLIIPEGYILVIDGNLVLRGETTLSGNVIVNGNITIDSNKDMATIQGTIYTSGTLKTDSYVTLGTEERPTFIFSEENVRFRRVATGYGYILSDKFEVNKNGTTINIIGGVYADTYKNLDASEVSSNTDLDTGDLSSFAVSPNLKSGEDDSQGYIYTFPR